MGKFELIMPKMGESITEATILSWSKSIGDSIEEDEAVLEIATDKVDSDVPSPVDGKLLEVFFQEGDVVPVGAVIATIETEAASAAADEPASANGHSKTLSGHEVLDPAEVAEAELQPEPVGAVVSRVEGGRFYSPLVLNIARKEGIPMPELELVPGTGREGRVTKKDILSYVKGGRNLATAPAAKATTAAAPAAKTTSTPAKAAPAAGGVNIPLKTFSHSGEYEIVEMDRMRKMIAENMVYSKHVSAHVTSFVEADMTPIVRWRNSVKAEFQAKYGEKLTFTPIFVEAIAKVLRELPSVNVSVDGNNILFKKDINIGIAVALPNDNLIVPVIKNADRLNLVGLSAAVNDLANRARNNKLRPEDLEGGTYTVSNVGTFGNVMGTPVIMQPQVAIMATGAIRKKPAVIETPEGDFIGIRSMMFLSHSYDHRVVDGALGGRFVQRVAQVLEGFDENRQI